MPKSNIYCVFDCDDICPRFIRAFNNITEFALKFPQSSITLYIPDHYHGDKHWMLNEAFIEDLDYLKGIVKGLEIGHHGYFHDNAVLDNCCEYYCKSSYFQNIFGYSPFYNKIARPPGWLMTNENAAYILNSGYTIAGHPHWYENLTMWGIDEPHIKHYNDGKLVLLHSHASKECGQNNIDNEDNFNNLIQYVEYLNENYTINWISSIELYKMARFVNNVNFEKTW
jgi:hypothetical protein